MPSAILQRISFLNRKSSSAHTAERMSVPMPSGMPIMASSGVENAPHKKTSAIIEATSASDDSISMITGTIFFIPIVYHKISGLSRQFDYFGIRIALKKLKKCPWYLRLVDKTFWSEYNIYILGRNLNYDRRKKARRYYAVSAMRL